MKSTRYVNGYIVIYMPDHPKAMSSSNWHGYVYQHIVVAENKLGRSLTDSEVVHYIDEDRSNNNQVGKKI